MAYGIIALAINDIMKRSPTFLRSNIHPNSLVCVSSYLTFETRLNKDNTNTRLGALDKVFSVQLRSLKLVSDDVSPINRGGHKDRF